MQTLTGVGVIFQKTLRNPVTIVGIGVHTGRSITCKILPDQTGSGIHFFRSDLAEHPEVVPIPAHYSKVLDTRMATNIGVGSVRISTIEHLMAAFFGLGISNARVEVDGPEIPILDGSAIPFMEAMTQAGVLVQQAPRALLKVVRSIEIHREGKWAKASPSDRLMVRSVNVWDHPAMGRQEYFYDEHQSDFMELASARTFGFLSEVEALKKMGLARGGSLENAIVLDQVGVLNPGGLRYPDEFVRHKVLDAIGDFALAGAMLHANIELYCCGHELHHELLKAVLKDAVKASHVTPSSTNVELAATA